MPTIAADDVVTPGEAGAPVRATAVRTVAAGAALASLSIAALVLVGWIAGVPWLTSLGRRWTPMVAGTALVVFAQVVAVIELAWRHGGARPRVLWASALAIGVLTLPVLVNFIALWTTGAHLYETGPAWRVAPHTAVGALLTAAAIALLGTRGRWRSFAEPLAAGALVLALVMLLAFLFGASPVSDLMGRVNMSPVTGACLALVSVGLIAVMPDGWLVSVLSESGPGSRLARRLLPFALLVPVALATLQIQAERANLFSNRYVMAAGALATIVLVTIAVVLSARYINRWDADRQRAARRQAFLAQATEVLASSLELERTLRAVADLCVPALADWCSIVFGRDDGSIKTAAVVHKDPAMAGWAREYERRFNPGPETGSSTIAALRTGRPQVLVNITEELLCSTIPDDGQREIILALGARSAMFLPLLVRGRAVGVLSLVAADSGRGYDERDVHVAQQLADRCAVAIEQARLFDELQRELERRRQAEAELRGLTHELEERVAHRTAELATANRELESFAYSVSHDLRTPLRALDGFSQAVLEDYADRLDDAGRDYLHRIRRGSQRMGELIDALLDLSRVSRGEMRREPVDLAALAREILETLGERHPGRRVAVDVDPDARATGDPRLLRVLLQNLLGNAWKFTGRQPDARIEFRAMRGEGNGLGTEFVVRDNGAGFDPAYANKLFGAFQRLHSDREFEGTGIGLATAQRIVHRHGGEIRAEGAPNQGAAFYFTLE